jgi:hypothetical protein
MNKPKNKELLLMLHDKLDTLRRKKLFKCIRNLTTTKNDLKTITSEIRTFM